MKIASAIIVGTTVLLASSFSAYGKDELISKTIVDIYRVGEIDMDLIPGGDVNIRSDIVMVLNTRFVGPKDLVKNGSEKHTFYISCPRKWVATSKDGKKGHFDISSKADTPNSDIEPFNMWMATCEGKKRALGR